jgi:hypothetical protein
MRHHCTSQSRGGRTATPGDLHIIKSGASAVCPDEVRCRSARRTAGHCFCFLSLITVFLAMDLFPIIIMSVFDILLFVILAVPGF